MLVGPQSYYHIKISLKPLSIHNQNKISGLVMLTWERQKRIGRVVELGILIQLKLVKMSIQQTAS